MSDNREVCSLGSSLVHIPFFSSKWEPPLTVACMLIQVSLYHTITCDSCQMYACCAYIVLTGPISFRVDAPCTDWQHIVLWGGISHCVTSCTYTACRCVVRALWGVICLGRMYHRCKLYLIMHVFMRTGQTRGLSHGLYISKSTVVSKRTSPHEYFNQPSSPIERVRLTKTTLIVKCSVYLYFNKWHLYSFKTINKHLQTYCTDL